MAKSLILTPEQGEFWTSFLIRNLRVNGFQMGNWIREDQDIYTAYSENYRSQNFGTMSIYRDLGLMDIEGKDPAEVMNNYDFNLRHLLKTDAATVKGRKSYIEFDFRPSGKTIVTEDSDLHVEDKDFNKYQVGKIYGAIPVITDIVNFLLKNKR